MLKDWAFNAPAAQILSRSPGSWKAVALIYLLPHEGWVFPAPSKSRHIERDSLKKRHARTIHQDPLKGKRWRAWIEKQEAVPVCPAVLLYAFRHS